MRRARSGVSLETQLCSSIGTAAAESFSVMAAPLLTRIYSAQAIGQLALFTSFISVASVSVSIETRAWNSIPASDLEAAQLTFASALISIPVSILEWCALYPRNSVFMARIWRCASLRNVAHDPNANFNWGVHGVSVSGHSDTAIFVSSRNLPWGNMLPALIVPSGLGLIGGGPGRINAWGVDSDAHRMAQIVRDAWSKVRSLLLDTSHLICDTR